jgi:type IV secretory pathway VirB2 component (pilin)
MKKISIFFTFLLLFLVTVSPESFAQTAGTCTGNAQTCASIAVGLSCTSLPGCTGATATVTTPCGGTATACTAASMQASGSLCKSNPGCTFTVSADANQNAFVDTLCNALKIVTGSGGKAFAAFAIISVGIGFFTGKISWGLMIGVTAGIAAMFGAPTIVAAISGGSAVDCGS